MRTFIYLKNNTLYLDDEKCVGCGKCLEVCPHGVFLMDGKRTRIANKRKCMECGACRKNCPVDAIKVDAGVGCAAAVIAGFLNKSEPTCGCSTDGGTDSKGCC